MIQRSSFRERLASYALALDIERHPNLAYIVAISLPLLVLHKLWTTRGIVYSSHSDLIAQFLSIKAAGRRALWEDATLPVWDPAMNAGTPALGNPQSGFFNPLEWGYFFLPVDWAANLHVLSTIVLSAVTMYLLARSLFSRAGTALFCAVAYALAFRMLATIDTGWLPNMGVYATVPLLPWALRRLQHEPLGRHAVILALVIGLLLVQGDLQQVYYAALAACVYTVLGWWRAPRAVRLRLIGFTLAALGIGLLLAMPAILPRWEYAQLSTRHSANYEFFLRRPPALAELRRLLDPEIARGERDEFWENNFYLGIWLLPLWTAAVFGNPRRSLPLLFAIVPAIVLCFDSPLLRLAYGWVPGFWMFRQTPRLLFGVQLLAVLVAGIGIDALVSCAATARLRRAVGVASVGTALLAACLVPSERHAALPVLLALIIVASIVTWARPTSALLLMTFVGLAVLDAHVRIIPIIETRRLSDALPVTPVQQYLQRGPGRGRAMVIGPHTFAYGTAGHYGIELVNGYSGIMLSHFVDYFELMQRGAASDAPRAPTVWNDTKSLAIPELLRALDVTRIATDRELPLQAAGFELVASYRDIPTYVFYRGVKQRPVYLWRATQPLGPAYFATELRPAPRDPNQLLNAIARSNSARVAYIEGTEEPVFGIMPATSKVVETHRGANRYAYDIEASSEAFLILSQVYYPGWEGKLDGIQVAMQRTNHALFGCIVPKGAHHLELRMRAPAFEVGALIAALGGLIALLWWVRSAPQRN